MSCGMIIKKLVKGQHSAAQEEAALLADEIAQLRAVLAEKEAKEPTEKTKASIALLHKQIAYVQAELDEVIQRK